MPNRSTRDQMQHRRTPTTPMVRPTVAPTVAPSNAQGGGPPAQTLGGQTPTGHTVQQTGQVPNTLAIQPRVGTPVVRAPLGVTPTAPMRPR